MPGDLPSIAMSPRDIAAIDRAVQSYMAYLRSTVPPSHARDTRIAALKNVRLRLANVPSGGAIATCIPLTTTDIQTLKEALEGFVRLVSQMVPPSQERDDILRQLEVLCQQLAAMLSSDLRA